MRARRVFAGLVGAALLFSGCDRAKGSLYANVRELEQLQLIQTIGFDREGEEVVISVSSGRAEGA